MNANPWVSMLSQPLRDYAVYPEGHRWEGSVRWLDFAALALTIFIVQALVRVSLRAKRRAERNTKGQTIG